MAEQVSLGFLSNFEGNLILKQTLLKDINITI